MAQTEIETSEARKLVACPDDYHEALIRNGYYMPRLSSSLCTNTYMVKVRDGEIWCPRYREVRLLPCPRPPSKEVLMMKLAAVMDATNRISGVDPHH